ncbi:Tat pathway signal protein [Streptomyces sp. NPDC093109]|uniref:galactose-binding domain-containing protein n=1 Tax=Streptomyces sp. NPDC093109 TaxID=3154977 RepID=UPI00344B5334
MPSAELSRRNFVQIAGAGTAAVTASGWLWQSAPAAYAAGPATATGATAPKPGPVDRLVLGDTASEAAHGLTTDGSEIVTGGNGVKARVATPLDPVAARGGELRFTMRTDPQAQNYLTLKLWGDDGSAYTTLAYINGEQIGYRRNHDTPAISFGFSGQVPGRFHYSTVLLPLEMTRGRTRAEITLRTYEGSFSGKVTQKSRPYYGVYTHTDARLDLSGENLTTYSPPTALADDIPDAEKQKLVDGFRTTQIALFDRLSAQVDADNTGRMSIVRYVDELRYYAQALTTEWSPAATGAARKAALLRIFKSIDNHVKDYYGNTRLVLRGGHQGDWGGYYGALGEALYLVENVIADPEVYGADAFTAFLDDEFTTGTQDGEDSLEGVDFDGGKLSRRAAWGRCLKANFDFARSRLSYIYNQMFYTYEGAWKAHEGLRVIGSAFYEGRARSHAILGESLGLVPFLGEEVLVGPRGEELDLFHSLFYHDGTARFTDAYVKTVAKGLAKSKLDRAGRVVRRLPYGKHYTGITAAGLTRENTYVGNYGEASRYIGEYFFKTWGHKGDEELNDRILKLALRNVHARGYTRYASVDDKGRRVMRIIGSIDERNWYWPGIPAYGPRVNEGQSLFTSGFELHMARHADRYRGAEWAPYWEYAREAVGFAQQQLADRQYFNGFAQVTANPKADLRLPDTYAHITGGRAEFARLGAAEAKKVMPQTDFRAYTGAELAALGVRDADYQRFAWIDVDNMFVSLRDGDTRIFGSLFQSNRGVAGNGRLHVITPTHEHVVQVQTNGLFQYRDYYARMDAIDADFMEDINTGDDWAPQALAGEICPIAYQPGIGTVRRENFEADTPFSGYTDFLTARYGSYLFGVNTTRAEYGNKQSYRLAVPANHRGSTVLDLVSGKSLRITGGHITVEPFTAVVLKLSDTATTAPLPSVVRYVTALPADTSITVAWTPTAGAATYTVKRAPRAEGPYTTVATGLTALAWRDTKVQQGRGYFYTVTAVNAAGTGWSSWRAAVTLDTPVSPRLTGTGWRDDRLGSQRRGTTSAHHTTAANGATVALTGGDGTGLGKGDDYMVATRDIEDSLLLVSRVLSGSGTVTARVDDHKGALTGLMLRDRIHTNTRYLYFGADATGKLVLANRTRDSRHDWQDDVRSPLDAGVSGFTAADHPYLRLVRDYETHQVIAQASADGTTWTYVGALFTPFPYAVHAGVAGSGSAVFSAVKVTGTAGGALRPYVAGHTADRFTLAWNKPEDAVGFTLYRTADAKTAATDPRTRPAGWEKAVTDTRERAYTEKELRHGRRWFKVVATLADGGTRVSEDSAVAVAETLAEVIARARKADPSQWTKKSYAAFTAEIDRIEQAGGDQEARIDPVYTAYALLVSTETLLRRFTVTREMAEASTVEWPGTGTKASNGWKLFDGDPATYTDTLAAESWVDVDAGAAGPVTIDKIRFHPRADQLSRANGTVFRGSDDGVTWTDLHTISGVSAARWYEAALGRTASYRKIRIYDNHDGRVNLAEVEFWYYLPDEA